MYPMSDPEAWLMQLDECCILKHKRSDGNVGVNHAMNCLVSFGDCGPKENNCDLCIFNDCNNNNESYSNLGGTYELPEGIVYGTQEARSYLAGSFEFKVCEIEVFRVTFI